MIGIAPISSKPRQKEGTHDTRSEQSASLFASRQDSVHLCVTVLMDSQDMMHSSLLLLHLSQVEAVGTPPPPQASKQNYTVVDNLYTVVDNLYTVVDHLYTVVDNLRSQHAST